MAISETASSTSNSSGGEYQVFLSFRGSDTRRGFTDTLYNALNEAGIHVFIDNEELRPGERIGGSLLRAIDDSRLYIPIFSSSYASSHWCLRELAKMVENTSKSEEEGNKKVILPIFYKVEPDDVKLRTPLYNNDIQNLKKKFSSEDIEMWQQALRKVGGISGMVLQNYTGEGHLSKSVVNEVVNRLQTRQKRVTKDLVGMEDSIAAINNLLDINSGGVRFIGIYGMGGIGKTTLAKIIYNQLCPHFGKNCSFLDDVRETAKTMGLGKLQGKLLSEITNCGGAFNIGDIDYGNDMIQQTICNKKVLIVLDDVDEDNQIQKLIGVNALFPGTRILVTTRDKSVLKIRGFKYKFEDYEMVGLTGEDSLQLFSRHAFNDDYPPSDYNTISNAIVPTAGGLPLALQAIGSSLFNQDNKQIWEDMLKELRKIPHDDVLGLLQITYNALKPSQQQIFLDIACFFIGRDKTNPIYMWNDCGLGPEYAISVLKNRCMIKVLDNNEFWMHDQFRDLGRAISNQERSRLWVGDDIICELRSTEINTSVQALAYDDWRFNIHRTFPRKRPLPQPVRDGCNVYVITPEQIKRFPHLRLLWLDTHRTTFQGDFTGCLSELKWIDLCDYSDQFTATNLNLENVVVMAISGWRGREDAVISLVEGAKKLKALTLARISSLQRTPTFSEDSVLEKLTFKRCSHLKEIDCSIGKLRGLTDLIVEDCRLLLKLPDQIGELKHLQSLSLKNCESLRELPDTVLKSNSLTKLGVSNTGVVKLPKTMSNLSQLHELLLWGTVIQELPKLPESLTTLCLTSRSLQTVPDLSNLTNLVTLILSDDSYSGQHSDMLQPCELPWIGGGLSKLRKMDLCLLNVLATSADWDSLTQLEELTLSGLDLQTLKQLPSNLRALTLYRTRVEQVELDGLPQLETLIINTCELITRISFPSSLRELRKVEMESCPKLVEVQFLGVLERMERLCIWECESLERLVCLSEEAGCNELHATELTDGSRRVSLVSSSLKTLQELHLRLCPELQEIQFVSALESLKEFTVDTCISLKRLGGLSNLKNLKLLNILYCESLQVVEGIDELKRLECEIWISYCGEVLGTNPYDGSIETTSSEWETESGYALLEEQDEGNEDDHNEADGMENGIRTRKRGTMKKVKRRGFCSCLTGLLEFIPWVMAGDDKKKDERDDD